MHQIHSVGARASLFFCRRATHAIRGKCDAWSNSQPRCQAQAQARQQDGQRQRIQAEVEQGIADCEFMFLSYCFQVLRCRGGFLDSCWTLPTQEEQFLPLCTGTGPWLPAPQEHGPEIMYQRKNTHLHQRYVVFQTLSRLGTNRSLTGCSKDCGGNNRRCIRRTDYRRVGGRVFPHNPRSPTHSSKLTNVLLVSDRTFHVLSCTKFSACPIRILEICTRNLHNCVNPPCPTSRCRP